MGINRNGPVRGVPKSNNMKKQQFACGWTAGCLLAGLGISLPVQADTVLYSSHYTQPSDVPAGFYGGGSATHLEDMETGALRFGISADVGWIIPPSFEGSVDSVLTDGNPGDAPGFRGHSWFAWGSVTFTFDTPHTAAGLVWTDGEGVTYAEFFRGATSLGTIGPLSLADRSFLGTTDEDTFFGATDPLGITSIHVWNTGGGTEVDHVQYGDVARASVPDGGLTASLLASSVGLLGFFRRLGRGATQGKK